MSEHDYEYECMRAELLGLPKPDKTDIVQATTQNTDDNLDSADNISAVTEELDAETEQLNRTTGGLDEINSILQNTQKKINKFKTVFGSVTSLLKGRLGADLKDEDSMASTSTNGTTLQQESTDKKNPFVAAIADVDRETTQQEDSETSTSFGKTELRTGKTADIEGMLSGHIHTLDSMVYKADEINAKMNFQNKQMRNHLNK